MMLQDSNDNEPTAIERYFLDVCKVSLDVARKLAEIYDEWQKPNHGRFNDWGTYDKKG